MNTTQTTNIIGKFIVAAACTFFAFPANSSDVTYANDSYTTGDTLTAANLNAKFNEIKADVNDNDSRIAALEATIISLQTQIDAINNSNVMALESYLTVGSDTRGPRVQLSGINLQLINGAGSEVINGLGNLVVGYDRARAGGNLSCSDGAYADLTSCVGAGKTWAISHKGGSHNLVIGSDHNYSQHNGLVVGFSNAISGVYSSVSGGRGNIASGTTSSVSGGRGNTASGLSSSVSGGYGCDTTAINWKWIVGGTAVGCSANEN